MCDFFTRLFLSVFLSLVNIFPWSQGLKTMECVSVDDAKVWSFRLAA